MMWTIGRLENWKQLMSVNMFSNPHIDDLFYDLSPDGGTYATILFCKLLAVTRETKVTLSIRNKRTK